MSVQDSALLEVLRAKRKISKNDAFYSILHLLATLLLLLWPNHYECLSILQTSAICQKTNYGAAPNLE
jgi:hypothetical protein